MICFKCSRPRHASCCDDAQVFANFDLLLRNERSVLEVATSKNIGCEQRRVDGLGLSICVYEGTSCEWLEDDFISKFVTNLERVGGHHRRRCNYPDLRSYGELADAIFSSLKFVDAR